MEKYITSWGLHQSITNKTKLKERVRLYKHWKNWYKQQKKFTGIHDLWAHKLTRNE